MNPSLAQFRVSLQDDSIRSYVSHLPLTVRLTIVASRHMTDQQVRSIAPKPLRVKCSSCAPADGHGPISGSVARDRARRTSGAFTAPLRGGSVNCVEEVVSPVTVVDLRHAVRARLQFMSALDASHSPGRGPNPSRVREMEHDRCGAPYRGRDAAGNRSGRVLECRRAKPPKPPRE